MSHPRQRMRPGVVWVGCYEKTIVSCFIFSEKEGGRLEAGGPDTVRSLKLEEGDGNPMEGF